MFEVKFRVEGGEDVTIFATPGENLLEVARKANVAIDAPCSGNASCGKCKVRLIEGDLDSPKTRHISDDEYAAGWRLSCVSKVTSDVVIGVPDIASAYKSRMKVADLSSKEELAIFDNIRNEITAAGISMTNSFEEVILQLSEPTLDDTMPDNERLEWALKEQLGVEQIELPFYIIHQLASVLREEHFNVRCIVEKKDNSAKVLDIMGAEDKHPICGLAIDIGTTTVSAVIINMQTGEIIAKASSGNGQIRYGADVINRIIESTKDGGRKRLQDAVIDETIKPLIVEMCMSAKLKMRRIYKMCVAANTTMNHLFLGLYSDSVRMEPYIPTFFDVEGIKAQDLGLNINPHADVVIAPNLGSYVGGDITAGTLASMVWNNPELSLFIDLGTNGELVFGNNEFLMSCACSAGPAFEGGDISCGMRATDGAIEACTIDKETMEPTFSIIGEEGTQPIGLCGSGIIDVIAELFKTGIINAKGKFVREGRRIRHNQYDIGSYVLAFKEDTGSVKDVEINEVDIDNFVRAKGAIFSAITTMLTSLGFDVSVLERVYVAGGIGSGINIKNAITIGMFPDIPLEMFSYIGNSSLSGAYAMTYSDDACSKVKEIAKTITYLELSTEPGYMDSFVAACFIPHTDASLFPSVEVQ